MATQNTTTPPAIAKLATQQVDLPHTALLGVFGTATAPRALIRLPKGETRTVSIGDRIARSTVAAITSDQLILSRNGRTQILRMPQS